MKISWICLYHRLDSFEASLFHSFLKHFNRDGSYLISILRQFEICFYQLFSRWSMTSRPQFFENLAWKITGISNLRLILKEFYNLEWIEIGWLPFLLSPLSDNIANRGSKNSLYSFVKSPWEYKKESMASIALLRDAPHPKFERLRINYTTRGWYVINVLYTMFKFECFLPLLN